MSNESTVRFVLFATSLCTVLNGDEHGNLLVVCSVRCILRYGIYWFSSEVYIGAVHGSFFNGAITISFCELSSHVQLAYQVLEFALLGLCSSTTVTSPTITRCEQEGAQNCFLMVFHDFIIVCSWFFSKNWISKNWTSIGIH